MKTLQEFKIASSSSNTFQGVSGILALAEKILSDEDMSALFMFASQPHLCGICTIENSFRAAEGSNLCADCFFR